MRKPVTERFQIDGQRPSWTHERLIEQKEGKENVGTRVPGVGDSLVTGRLFRPEYRAYGAQLVVAASWVRRAFVCRGCPTAKIKRALRFLGAP